MPTYSLRTVPDCVFVQQTLLLVAFLCYAFLLFSCQGARVSVPRLTDPVLVLCPQAMAGAAATRRVIALYTSDVRAPGRSVTRGQ